MKNDIKLAKIQKFLDDETMAEAVREAILESFLDNNSKDVNYLASSMIAINLLKEAWKDLKKYQRSVQETKTNSQIGL